MKSFVLRLSLLAALVVIATASRPSYRPTCRVAKRTYNLGAEWNKGCQRCKCMPYGKVRCWDVSCSCKVGKKWYKHGAVVSRPKCNVCKCNNRKINCTKRSCCPYGKKWLSAGQTFKKGCGNCICLKNGKVNCRNVKCKCKVGNKWYNHLQKFNIRCNQCRCNNGKVSCTKKNCCRYGNKWLSPGAKFNKGCQSCKCLNNGRINCWNVTCSCRVGKKVYKHGQIVSRPKCNTCRCNNTKISCTKKGCCIYGKKWYSVGKTIKHYCNSCVCKAKPKTGKTYWACGRRLCYPGYKLLNILRG